MGPLDPAVAILVANLPITLLVLFCFHRGWFRLGTDVKAEREYMQAAHKIEVDLIIQAKDEYKARWEEEKRDRLALTERIVPLAEAVRESAKLTERTVEISEELLDERIREAGAEPYPQRTTQRRDRRRSQRSAKPAPED